MEKDSLRNRLFRKHQTLSVKNLLQVKQPKHQSSEKTQLRRQNRSNSVVRLPSLERLPTNPNNQSILNTSIVSGAQVASTTMLPPTHHINLQPIPMKKGKSLLTQQSLLDISQLRLPANRPRGMSLKSTPVGQVNKLPTNDKITYLLKTGDLTIPKLIAALNTFQEEQFLYLKCVGLYEYEACSSEDKGSNYITLSRNGVLVDNEFISMQKWLRDETNFRQLKKIELWKQYLYLKSFTHWKNAMKRHTNQITSNKLMRFGALNNSQCLVESLKIRKQCLKLADNYHIFYIQGLMAVEFEQYRQNQEEWIVKLLQKISKRQAMIESHCLSICFETVKQFPLILETKQQLNKSVPVIDNVTMRFDIKSTLKTTLQKLYRIIRCVDLELMEALGRLLINSIKDVTESLYTKIDTYDKITNELLKIGSLPKEEFIRRRDDILMDSQFNNWINFSMAMNGGKLEMTPSLQDVSLHFTKHIKKLIQSIAEFKRPLVMSQCFEFLRKNIKNIMASLNDKNQPPMFTFVDYLNNNEEWQDSLADFNEVNQAFMDIFMNRLKTLRPYLDLYEKYHARKVLPELTFSEVNHTFQELEVDSEYIQRLQDGEYIIYGFVSFGPLKQNLLDRLELYKGRLRVYLPARFFTEVQNLKQILKEHKEVLDNLLVDAKRFVLVLREVTKLQDLIKGYQSTIEDMKKLTQLYQENYKAPLEGCNELISLLQTVKTKMGNFLSTRDTNINRYRKEVLEMQKELETEVNNVEIQLQEGKYYKINDDPAETYGELDMLSRRMKEMADKLEQLLDYMSALSIQVDRVHKLELLNTELNSIKNVWEVLTQLQDLQRKLNRQQVLAIELEVVKNDKNHYSEMIEAEMKKNDRQQLTEVAKNRVADLQNQILLVELLQSKHLRSKDWEEFYNLLQNRLAVNLGPSNPYNAQLTYGFLVEKQMTNLNSEIMEIVVKAKKEIEIMQQLDTFETKWWPNIRLETEPYDGNITIFTENQEIRRDLEENMMMLLGILNNKYGGFVRHRCQSLFRNLNSLIKLLEELLLHQHHFIDLYPIMSSSFCQKQLPNQYKDFQKIVASTSRQMKILVNPVKGLAGDGTMTQLLSNNKQFDSIQRKLANFMEKKRLQFQRFYFLQDREMMELLAGVAKDSSLQRMFEGVTGWYEQNGQIVGVKGVGGQNLKLLNWTFKNQELQVIFKQLEEGIKHTLKTLIRQTLHAYQFEMKNMRELQSRIPWMCAYTVEWILYCKQIEINYLYHTNEMSLQIQLLQSNLHELLQNPLNNSNLITLTLHMIHLTKELQHNNVTHVLDYHWQSVIRYYYEEEVAIRCLGALFEWGGEYQGLWQVMVNTKDIRRAYCSVVGGLNWGIGVVMQGPSGTGKTETLKELARSMAKFCLVFNCSSLVSTKLLQKLLAGLCYTGSWICLDEINRLEIEVMSVVASQIAVVRGALLANKDHFNFFGKEISLTPGIGIFSTMNPNYRSRTQLTQNLKSYFRCVSVNMPEYDKIIEVMLYSRGFKEATALSAKICKLYQLLNMQFNEQKHYDFGMRGMKCLMTLIDKYRAEKHTQENSIKLALYDNLGPRLMERDVLTFDRTVADVFSGPSRKKEQNSVLEDKYQALVSAVQLGTIMLGEPDSLKTTLVERYLRETNSLVRRFNPNSMNDMYFFGGKLQSGWQVGVVEEILRQAINTPHMKHVLYLDGRIKSQWVENFNSLLDDTKLLTLPSGGRLKLTQGNFRLIIQTCDLVMASPATVTRCSIVFTSKSIITLNDFINFKLSGTKFPPELTKALYQLLQKLTREQINQVMYMLPCLIPQYLLGKEEGWMYSEILGVQRIVVYLIGLLGSYDKIRKMLIKQLVPLKLPITKYKVNFDRYPEGEYVLLDPVSELEGIDVQNTFYVPTPVSCLIKFISHKAIENSRNILLRGQKGFGKTEALKWSIDLLKIPCGRVRMHMVSWLQAVDLSILLQKKYQIERKDEKEEELVPLDSQRMIVQVDNISMANEQCSEFLRTFMERRVHMELKTLEERRITKTSVLMEANGLFDRRLQKHIFCMQPPNNPDITSSIFLKVFTTAVEATSLAPAIKNELYSFFLDKFVRVLSLFIFEVDAGGWECSMRQLRQLGQGMRQLSQQFKTSQQAVTMVLQEFVRVFFDRLRKQDLLQRTKVHFHKIFTDNFNKKYVTELDQAMKPNNQILFSNLFNEPEIRQLSQDLNDEYKKMEEYLKKNSSKYLISKFALTHLIRLLRVRNMDRFNCILVGDSGSGRKSLTELASKVSGCQLYEFPKKLTDIELTKYLFSCLKASKNSQNPNFFYICYESAPTLCLDLLQSVLSSNIAIFQEEDRNYAYDHGREDNEQSNRTVEEVIADYLSKAMAKIKVVVCCQPRNLNELQNYPSLYSSSYINVMGVWPESAMEEFSQKILGQSQDKGVQAIRDKLVRFSVEIFNKVKELNESYSRITKHFVQLSPMQHIRFVKAYLKILSEEQSELKLSQERFSKSIMKIGETEAMLKNMKEKIIEMEPQLKIKKEELTQLMPGLDLKRKEAGAVRKDVEQDQERVERKKAGIEDLKMEAEKSLKQAQPLLSEAANSVATIKRAQLSEIKSNMNPNKLVLFTLQNLSMLLGDNGSWESIKKILSDTELLTRLKNCTPKYEDYLKVRKRISEHPEWTLENIEKVSVACKSLAKWVINVGKFCQIHATVEKQKAALNELKKDLIESEYALKATQQKFNQANERLGLVEKEFRMTNSLITKYEHDLQINREKLSRASAIQTGLGDSVQRWRTTVSILDTRLIECYTEAMFTAALVELSGGFPGQMRDQLLTFMKERANGLKLTYGTSYDVLNMYSAIERQEWEANGLSSDPTSLQNATFLKYHMSAYPIIVDPDNQAISWIQKTYEHKFIMTKNKFIGAQKDAERAIRGGYKLILMIDTELDDLCRHVIEAKVEMKGTRKMIEFGGGTHEIDPNFKLILCSKERSPHFSSSLLTNHPVINFSVTRKAMQSQLIVEILKQENEELHRQKTQIERSTQNNKAKLVLLQNQIVEVLSQNKTGLLDDDFLVNILQNSSKTSTEISLESEVLEHKTANMKIFLTIYQKLCEEAASIYIQSRELTRINPMLSWSYSTFIRYFLAACLESVSQQVNLVGNDKQASQVGEAMYQSFVFSQTSSNGRPTTGISRASSRLSSRTKSFPVPHDDEPPSPKNYRSVPKDMDNELAQQVYRKPERVVDESKKGKMDEERMKEVRDILLSKIKVSLDSNERLLLALLLCFDSVKKQDIAVLSQAATRRQNLKAYFEVGHVTDELKQFNESIKGSPQFYNSVVTAENPFQINPRLRPISYLILMRMLKPQRFGEMLEKYIRHEGYEELLSSADVSVFQVFKNIDCQTPALFIMGQDPLNKITDFLSRRRMMRHTLVISMGEGQTELAERALEKEFRRDTILVLHNLHICPSLYPLITKTLEQLQSYSKGLNPKFRLILVMKPTKAFPQAVSGRSYKVTMEPPTGLKNKMHSLLRNNYSMIGQEDEQSKAVVYAITLLHAVISDRSKFGPVGWNVPYQYTEMEYQNSLRIIKQVVTRASNLNCTTCNIDEMEPIKDPLDFEALRKLIGDISYEGRVTDQLDRHKLQVLTEQFLTPDVLNPGYKFLGLKNFVMPKSTDYDVMMEHIESLQEDPTIYGLHPEQQPEANGPLQILKKIQGLYLSDIEATKDTIKSMPKPEIPLVSHSLDLVDIEITQHNNSQVDNPKVTELLLAIKSTTKIFDLRAFKQPRRFFSEIRKQHAVKNNVEFQAVTLQFSFQQKEDTYGITNLKIEAGKIVNGMVDQGLSGQCPVLYVLPISKKKDKQHGRQKEEIQKEQSNRVKIPLYKNRLRQGEINSFGQNTNLVGMIELPARKPQDIWVLRGTALILGYEQ